MDLGPAVGEVVAHDTPEQGRRQGGPLYTGRFLARILEPAKKRQKQRPKVAAAA